MKSPFLNRVLSTSSFSKSGDHPLNISAFSRGIDLKIATPVTFLVGENGTGKSTLIEGIADLCGFNITGGGRNHKYGGEHSCSSLAPHLRLSWLPKITDGFFMRAESYFNFASYIDVLAESDDSILSAYGGKSLHNQSHGESFLSLFSNRIGNGIYLLDEPEAALSPSRQLALMTIMSDLTKRGMAQFIISTHSPILITFPGSSLFQFSDNGIATVHYSQTDHFSLTKDFLNSPERYHRHIM